MIRELLRPDTIKEALALKKANPTYRYLAGGTWLYSGAVMEKEGSQDIDGLIWTGRLGLNNMEIDEQQIKFGSYVTLQELLSALTNAGLKGVLYSSIMAIANRNIRNAGTIGGNIASCKSSSDPLPALMVLDTKIKFFTVEKSDNPEIMGISEYIDKLYKSEPSHNDLLLSEIVINREENRIASFSKISRTANDLALTNGACSLRLIDGTLKDVRLAAGCMGPRPLRLSKTEIALEGIAANSKELHSIIRKNIIKDTKPIDDFRASAEYRLDALSGSLASMLRDSVRMKGGLL